MVDPRRGAKLRRRCRLDPEAEAGREHGSPKVATGKQVGGWSEAGMLEGASLDLFHAKIPKVLVKQEF